MNPDYPIRKEPKKPPLGVRPRWVVEEERFTELLGGINRHWDMDILPPVDWITELMELVKKIEAHRDER